MAVIANIICVQKAKPIVWDYQVPTGWQFEEKMNKTLTTWSRIMQRFLRATKS